MGVILVVPVIIGAFCGHWIDQYFDIGFSFLIIGTFLGILIATILTVRKVSRVIKQADDLYAAKKKTMDKGEKNKKEEIEDDSSQSDFI